MLEPLDHVVVDGPCADHQAVADAVGALVVVRVHPQPFAGDLPQPRARLGEHVVHAVGAVVQPVRADVDAVGEVLLERAAAGDIDQLEAAADAEHRQVALDGPAGEAQLRGVASLVAGAGRRVAVGAVHLGSDVVAADEQDAVESVEHIVRVVGPVRVGRQDQRLAARQADALDVALADNDCVHRPVRHARVRPVAGDADGRPAHAEKPATRRMARASRAAGSRARGSLGDRAGLDPRDAGGDLVAQCACRLLGELPAERRQLRAAVAAAALDVAARSEAQRDLLGLAGAGGEHLGQPPRRHRLLIVIVEQQQRVQLHRPQVDIAGNLEHRAVERAEQPQPRRHIGGRIRCSGGGIRDKRKPRGAAAGWVGDSHRRASSRGGDRFRPPRFDVFRGRKPVRLSRRTQHPATGSDPIVPGSRGMLEP